MMSPDKYTFTRTSDDGRTVSHTVQTDQLDEILEQFIYFLKGCSFTYVEDLIYVKSNGKEHSVFGSDTQETFTEMVDRIVQRYDTLP
jgi:hypothetical protein